MQPNHIAIVLATYTLIMPTSQAFASAEIDRQPQFKDFSSENVPIESKAPLVLNRGTEAWQYRTMIRDRYAATPVNFAGHFVAIHWGCGTPCQQWAFIDAKTGTVYFSNFSTGNGALFHADSALFVSDPPGEELESRSCEIDNITCQLWRGDLVAYYRWTGTTMEKIARPES